MPEHNLFKSLKLPACEDQRVKGNQSTHKQQITQVTFVK